MDIVTMTARTRLTAGPDQSRFDESAFRQIELLWPAKDLAHAPVQEPDGRWRLEPQAPVQRLSPLVELGEYGQAERRADGLVVSGDRLAALSALRRRFSGAVALAYLDAPRIEIDDQATAFRGDPTYAYSTWLTVLRAHIAAIVPLLSRKGVLAIHTGDLEQAYARLLAEDVFGRTNYIGTVVWQRSYGPRNMRGMKEFTATHDVILLVAADKSALPAVGLREDTAAAGFDNPDDDPRGPWKAAHKGARTRRERSDFNAYVPPYRWALIEGQLPAGMWRLSPLTGVLWGIPEEVGEFPLKIQVTDRNGASATANLTLTCTDSGGSGEWPDVPWLFSETGDAGDLRITTSELPPAVAGQEYSAICVAQGGNPYRSTPKRPGSGRYWEFADNTLRRAYVTDSVDLGDDGDVIPRIKTYAFQFGGEVVRNQQTWWPAKARDGTTLAGFTQDATKHLKKLQELGVITETVTTAKPEHLLARFLRIFTRPGQLVLEPFGSAGDMAAVAIKLKRSFVYLSGASDRELALLERCALPRLRAVVDGEDRDLEARDGEIRLSGDAYVPYEGGGGFVSARVGDWLFEQRPNEDFPRLNRQYRDPAALLPALLTSQGFLPDADDPAKGSGPNSSQAVVVPPNQRLDAQGAALLASQAAGTSLTVYYFMASDDFDPVVAPPNIVFRRVPSEIAVFS